MIAVLAAGSVVLSAAPAYAHDGAAKATATATATATKAAANTRLGTKLAREVTAAGVNRHLIALQRIADTNGGNRAASTPGHEASATYVHDKLAAAGWNVSYQDFDYEFAVETESFTEVSPGTTTAPTIDIMEFSPQTPDAGITAPLAVVPNGQNPTGPGCVAADFAGATYTGTIALIQRGGCSFAIKAQNAAAAGAVGVVIYNNAANADEELNGTLGTEADARVPTGGITRAEGEQFVADAAAGPVTVNLVLQSRPETRTSRNVIAETPGGRADNVVMAGAHLDSVPAGPGINDNGSGSATLLELGLKLADEKVKNKVRLAFWSAEELGLLGSEAYVGTLSFEQQLDIALYLNFDMIGSPNWGEFVYDGDDSDGEGAGAGPFGSAQIEALIAGYVQTAKGVPTEGTDFDGRSDYGPFIAVGIPSGGIFTGAEVPKTPEQAAKWGGTAGVAFDPCYHSACDNLGNVDRTILDKNADAVAFSVGRYALDTSDINGVGLTGATAKATAAKAKAARAARAAARVAAAPTGAAA
ncbi:MAG TPA: M28 family metallopeptidase [Mycobacteriales bacterium]|nr:M28 family metallopeptidase [Mycobacteriales bacterium]